MQVDYTTSYYEFIRLAFSKSLALHLPRRELAIFTLADPAMRGRAISFRTSANSICADTFWSLDFDTQLVCITATVIDVQFAIG
jgi:hypothetical protein